MGTGPGTTTGGEDFLRKISPANTFFFEKKGGDDVFQPKFPQKPEFGYPVNFDRSLIDRKTLMRSAILVMTNV